ncbi:uncharacterized protein LOC763223 [Strongylocentrotus purpuratus]|uniref:SWIM-type domain-containing protein n=1 Tax=Strongylocentrotus purpuratus TaxID=7668 RepID=A0A7M7LVX1_STRPU|nr:uncharacterized protein LOC763223 [Strongylocentrotus purpuratus]|eukprot:XP_011668590.1 PREDICTED: uncharacterized protein LOC763223 [Strongylocentrotus purpuratus]
MANFKCECETLDPQNTILKDYLPTGYDYRLCLFEAPEDNSENFKASFRIKLSTRDKVEAWFKALQEKSATTWRVRKTYPCNHGIGARNKNIFRLDYGCHHNTRPKPKGEPRKSSKHTSCSATVYLVVKRQADERGRVSRSSDPHIRMGYLTRCTINNSHNHAIRSAEAMRRRDVSQETRGRLLKLYEEGYKPSAALEALKLRLQEEYGSDYAQKSADRSVCPDVQYCFRLYYSLYKQDTPKKIRKTLLKAIETKLRLNDINDNYFKMATTGEGHAVVVICSASMQRVHEFWPTSKELCYLDTFEGLERQNWRVTVLLTPSPIGELPLGILMSSSGSSETLSLGLQLLHKLLPKFSYYERGHSGPSVVITREDAEEQLTLHKVYPTAELLVNPQALIQSAKDWLWNPVNSVSKADRQELLRHLRAVIEARTPDDLNSIYELARQDAENRTHLDFVEFLDNLYERREMWSLALKSSPALLNNRVLGTVKVPMEKILQKVKGYNILRLVDDLLNRLGPYYERKLIDAGNNGSERVTFASYPTDLLGPETTVKKVNEIDYEVLVDTSDGQNLTCFHINMEHGLCSCHDEQGRIPCLHQMAVFKKFGKNSGTFFPTELRSLFTKIATGKETQDDVWYQPLTVSREVQITSDGKQELPLEDIKVQEAMMELSAVLEQQAASRMINDSSDDDEGRMEETVGYVPREAHQQLQEVFADLEKRLLDDPVAFEGPVRAFAKNYLEAVQQGRLASAVGSFGQSRSVTGSKIKRTGEDLAPDTSHLHVIAETEEVHRRKMAVKRS